MTDIYNIVSKLSPKFKEMAFGICKDENEVNNAVQELMLYFLQMNPEVLSSIYEKDGKQGILRYGAVALRRALTSPRSAYYYKYKKYYEFHTTSTIEGITPDNTDYNIKDKEQIEERLEWIEDKLKDVYWFDAEVFKVYYLEGHSLNSMAKATKINRNTLFKSINNVKKYLINEK